MDETEEERRHRRERLAARNRIYRRFRDRYASGECPDCYFMRHNPCHNLEFQLTDFETRFGFPVEGLWAHFEWSDGLTSPPEPVECLHRRRSPEDIRLRRVFYSSTTWNRSTLYDHDLQSRLMRRLGVGLILGDLRVGYLGREHPEDLSLVGWIGRLAHKIVEKPPNPFALIGRASPLLFDERDRGAHGCIHERTVDTLIAGAPLKLLDCSSCWPNYELNEVIPGSSIFWLMARRVARVNWDTGEFGGRLCPHCNRPSESVWRKQRRTPNALVLAVWGVDKRCQGTGWLAYQIAPKKLHPEQEGDFE